MKKIEAINPYTIVEENDLYGIINSDGELVVPCIMDMISNEEDEDFRMNMWEDFFCVTILKDGKVGFFTTNGKYIEPVYKNYTVDPCGGDIHVETEYGYGMLRAPEYVFEEIEEEYSLLSDIDFDLWDDDEENEEYNDEDINYNEDKPKTWNDMGIQPDIISAIAKRLHALGYELAQESWNAANNDENDVNIKEFVDSTFSTLGDHAIFGEKLADIKSQGSDDEATFWSALEEDESILSWCIHNAKVGAADFISRKSLSRINISDLNNTIKEYICRENNSGHYTTFRIIDGLLPHPENYDGDGCDERGIIPVVFPVGKRPSYKSSNFFLGNIEGEIGAIYLYEHGMRAYYVSVDVYDSENPLVMLKENAILDENDIVLSELLTCLQDVIDPEKKNTKLVEAIDRAIEIENGADISPAQILTDCGIHVFYTPHCKDEDVAYIDICDDDVLCVYVDSDSPAIHCSPFFAPYTPYGYGDAESLKGVINRSYYELKQQNAL